MAETEIQPNNRVVAMSPDMAKAKGMLKRGSISQAQYNKLMGKMASANAAAAGAQAAQPQSPGPAAPQAPAQGTDQPTIGNKLMGT